MLAFDPITRYFYADKKNRTQGPFTAAELYHLYCQGKITQRTQIIQEHDRSWRPFSYLLKDISGGHH
ncbi:MAG: GYF domain-containing protein [bacterium]